MAAKKATSLENSLFSAAKADVPLPERLRPKQLAEVLGQSQLIGEGGVLSRMVAAKKLQSMILWGPPGCGKTTIARLLADEAGYEMQQVSAVASGVNDLKAHFEQARERALMGKRPVLFVDEIHRFNRAQQDVLLPVLEDGTVTLIGATTENPSFALNAALLSRARVMVLNRLDGDALAEMLQHAEAAIGKTLPLTEDARRSLLAMADGDGRFLLTMVEALVDAPADMPIDDAALVRIVQRRPAIYDKTEEQHYNLISALHKSLRGSDVDAALYWFARMLEGGEDVRYIMRRMVRFAAEDIGMADPQALVQAQTAAVAYERLGSPEGELCAAQCIIYLATAPKSNAQYAAYKMARAAAREHGSLTPPAHILNAPTTLMKELGYGKNYAYDHDVEDGFSGQNYFPDGMQREQFYQPVERGFERDIKKRLDYWANLRSKKQGGA